MNTNQHEYYFRRRQWFDCHVLFYSRIFVFIRGSIS
jgi:hypothetical protein